MASAEHKELLAVDRDKLLSTILKYEDYPKFVDGCTRVEVERPSPGKARVTYHVSMMKDIVYTVEISENPDAGVVEWHLLKGDVMKRNSGKWTLKSAGPGKTDVTYKLEIEFSVAVPSFILNRLIKGNLPGMVRSFGDQARKA